jgi:chromosome segregation ATPase
MKHTAKEITEMMRALNNEKVSPISDEQINRVVYGGQKLGFDSKRISVNSVRAELKAEERVVGKSKYLNDGVNCLISAIQQIDLQKLKDEEKLLEAVIPEVFKEKVLKLNQAYVTSLKEVTLEAGRAITDQNNRAYAQMNQNLSNLTSEFNQQIQQLEQENASLHSQYEECTEQIDRSSKKLRELSDNIQSLQKENDELKRSISEKESLEAVIERLRERLDAYENSSKPINPSQATPKK